MIIVNNNNNNNNNNNDTTYKDQYQGVKSHSLSLTLLLILHY